VSEAVALPGFKMTGDILKIMTDNKLFPMRFCLCFILRTLNTLHAPELFSIQHESLENLYMNPTKQKYLIYKKNISGSTISWVAGQNSAVSTPSDQWSADVLIRNRY